MIRNYECEKTRKINYCIGIVFYLRVVAYSATELQNNHDGWLVYHAPRVADPGLIPTHSHHTQLEQHSSAICECVYTDKSKSPKNNTIFIN